MTSLLTRSVAVAAYDALSPEEYPAKEQEMWAAVLAAGLDRDDDVVRAFRRAHERHLAERAANRDARQAERDSAIARRDALWAKAGPLVQVEQAMAHLRALDSQAADFLFVFIDRFSRQVTTRRFSPERIRQDLRGYVETGHEVYVTVQAFNGERRRAVDWPQQLRAFVLDVDFEKDLAKASAVGDMAARRYRRRVQRLLLSLRRHPPDLVVHSGHGLHFYWWIDREDVLNNGGLPDTTRWLRYEHGLARAARVADLAVTDLPRVLRLAGSVNLKDEGSPRAVTIIHARSPRAPSKDLAEDLRQAFGFAPEARGASPSRRPNVAVDVEVDVQLKRIAEASTVIERGHDCHVIRCPSPDHDDINPSFLVFSKADGFKVFKCRRCAAPPQHPDVRVGAPPSEHWCAWLQIPLECIQGASAIRVPSRWYVRIADVDELEMASPIWSVASKLAARRTHNAVALWDFDCPFSAVPVAGRLFVDRRHGIQLRCTCVECREQGAGIMNRLRDHFELRGLIPLRSPDRLRSASLPRPNMAEELVAWALGDRVRTDDDQDS